MKIQTIKYSKQYKLGLPDFSNITVGMEMTVEYEEGEEPNHEQAWDILNNQIYNQTNLDPAWLKTQDTKDYHKLIIKVRKPDKESEVNVVNESKLPF